MKSQQSMGSPLKIDAPSCGKVNATTASLQENLDVTFSHIYNPHSTLLETAYQWNRNRLFRVPWLAFECV